MAVMAAWWLIGYRHRRFGWLADVVAAVALGAIAVALANPAQVLCVYFVALCYRALFGRQRDMVRRLAQRGLLRSSDGGRQRL